LSIGITINVFMFEFKEVCAEIILIDAYSINPNIYIVFFLKVV